MRHVRGRFERALRPRDCCTGSVRDEGGFTIVEILVVGTVVSVLLGGMTLVLSDVGRQMWTTTEPRLMALTDAQRALDRVSEDLRSQARQTGPNRPTCPAAVAGACTSPPCLQFVPIPPPPCPIPPCPPAPEQVTYLRDGAGNLVRRQGNQNLIIASGLQDNAANPPGFRPTCDANNLPGLVRLELTVQAQMPQGRAATQTFDAHVWVRSP